MGLQGATRANPCNLPGPRGYSRRVKSMSGLDELYRRYSQDVFRFSFWLSGDRSEAEDITSETFVRAWAGADDLRMSTVKAYLLAIARNLFLHRRRRGRRDHPLDDTLVD